jgi:hypothetical protein
LFTVLRLTPSTSAIFRLLRGLLDLSPTQDEAHRQAERRLEAVGRLVRGRA